MNQPEGQLITYAEAAERYKVTRRHLQRLRADGKLTAHSRPADSTRYFDTAELDKVLGTPPARQLIEELIASLPRRYHLSIREVIGKIDRGEVSIEPDPYELEKLDQLQASPDLDELLALTDAELDRSADLLAALPSPEDLINLAITADLHGPKPTTEIEGVG